MGPPAVGNCNGKDFLYSAVRRSLLTPTPILLTPLMPTPKRELQDFYVEKAIPFFILWGIAVLVLFAPVFGGGYTFLSLADNCHQTYPWFVKMGQAIRSFALPLWDFGAQSGTSFIGENQTGMLYPLGWLFAFFTVQGNLTQYWIEIYTVLHFIIGAVGMFLFLRLHGISKLSSIIAGLIFCTVGNIAWRAGGQANIFAGNCLLPWVLVCVALSQQSTTNIYRRLFWLCMSGLLIGMQDIAGHVQPAAHTGLLAALYVLASGWSMVPKTLNGAKQALLPALRDLAIIAVIAAMFAAPQIVSLIEYLAYSLRWVGKPPHPVPGLAQLAYNDFASDSCIDFKDLLTLINPRHLVKGGYGTTLFFSYTGLAFALVGLFSKSKWRPLCIGTVLLAICFALGKHLPPVAHTLQYVPVFGKIREPSLILIIFQFAACWIAAMGLDAVRSGIVRKLGMTPAMLVMLLTFAAAVYEGHTFLYSQAFILRKSNVPTTPSIVYAHTDLVKHLEQLTVADNGMYRASQDNEALPSAIGDVFNLRGTRGHRSGMRKAYFNFLCRDWSAGSVVNDRLGVKYFVSPKDYSNFKLLAPYGALKLYERPTAFPIFQWKRNGEISSVLGSATWHTNSVDLDLTDSNAGRLLFAQIWYPGWNVEVDGQQRPLIKAQDPNFMAVDIRKGDKKVTFSYAPRLFYYSLLFTAFALAATAYFFVKGRQQGKRPLPEQPERIVRSAEIETPRSLEPASAS